MTYKIMDIEHGSDAWKSYRRTHIGASEASAIMGCGFQSAYDLWMDKLGFGKEQTNPYMRRGSELEPIAREEFIKQTGILMTPQVIESTVHPFMIASLDGLDFDAKYAVEIKVPGKEKHAMAMDGVVPEIYKSQLNHQMFILQIPMIYYYSYSEDSSKIIEVPYDSSYTMDMIEKEKEFFRCLTELESPALSEKDYATCTDVQALEEATMLIQDLLQLKEVEKRVELRKQNLKQYAGNSNMKIGDVKLTKIVRKGVIDYKNAEQLQGLDLEYLRKPSSTYWKIA